VRSRLGSIGEEVDRKEQRISKTRRTYPFLHRKVCVFCPFSPCIYPLIKMFLTLSSLDSTDRTIKKSSRLLPPTMCVHYHHVFEACAPMCVYSGLHLCPRAEERNSTCQQNDSEAWVRHYWISHPQMWCPKHPLGFLRPSDDVGCTAELLRIHDLDKWTFEEGEEQSLSVTTGPRVGVH
jgi:hypothetical protein